jgi:nitroreductase
MNALEALHTRNSVSQLNEPGPNREQLDDILKAGFRANDRKHLRPWKFIVFEGEARKELGELCLSGLMEDDPDMSKEAQEKELNKPLRAPTIICVVAVIRPDEKVPDVEQLLSAGGAAQMMSLAAHAVGLGSIWRTGSAAHHAGVHKKLGLDPDAGDQIVGFLYIGSPGTAKALAEFELDDIVKHWR